MQASKAYSSIVLYRRLMAQARPYWGHIVGYLGLSLVATPLVLLTPLPLKIAVDSVIGSQPLPAYIRMLLPQGTNSADTVVILLLGGLVVMFAVLLRGQGLAKEMLKTYVGEKLVLGMRSRVFLHVQRLSLAYHDREGSADSNYRIQTDTTAIRTIVVESLIPMISAVAMLIGMLYVTARLSPRLALVALSICPPLLIITVLMRGRLRRQWRDVKKLESAAQSVVQEVLGAVRVVKAFGREEQEHDRFQSRSSSGMSARLRAAFQENCYTMLVGVVTAIGTAAVLFVGVRDVRAGSLSLGNLLLVMAWIGKLYDPLKLLGKQLTEKQKALASAERVFALLDQAPDVVERPDALPLARAEGALRWERVQFSYPGGPTVLRDVSLDVAPGTRVGIAGTTGSGKTTLVNLLTRFYDPDKGRILLDDVDLRDYRLADLRNQFAIVLQEPVLFSTSIAENIAYGRPDATEEQVVAAARAANADNFIRALPRGYKTQVGERGMCLSGGERQRISLARAFLKDAPILILDEPTSSVDGHTEGLIMEAMERLMRGRTTFMIAHRLSTLRHCDVQLTVENGHVTSTPAPSTELASWPETVSA